MTRTLIVAVTALALSFGIAAAAIPSQGSGQQSQTVAYVAGGEASFTPLHEGGR